MALKHSNPQRPRIDRERRKYWARAPYNFVPLPDKVITIPEKELLGHDRYHTNGLSGCIDCTLETSSTTYVRGMFTEDEFEKQGRTKPDKLTVDEKNVRAPFYAIERDDHINGKPRPVIPGSTLRGMIRSLVEIAGFGRMRWVANQPTFTFRAVAAPGNDPLKEPYSKIIKASNVRAGYLEKRGARWFIRPALTAQDMGWPSNEFYLKVKETFIQGKDIPNFLRLDSPNYRPQLHDVSFGVEFRKRRSGPFVAVSHIGSRQAGYQYEGVLVCSGNMLESARADQKSPRRNHALVLKRNEKIDPVPIAEQAIRDYRAGLTPYQRDELAFDWAGGDWGCLKDGAPVFYVPDDEIIYFGHSPNFRIPAIDENKKGKGASNPRRFVPEEIWKGEDPDLADAIFGWVEDMESGLKGQCAGRVFFSDARCNSDGDIWESQNPLAPRTLASPKPTTFQHYLVQHKAVGKNEADHDPDIKPQLAHYGSPPTETEIRGYKLYWHKGERPEITATDKEREHEKQLTRILPIKSGVRFSFKIHFENLLEQELGALLWALTLPGEQGKVYRHKLGMGKPLGLGAVHIQPKLTLADRKSRYRQLFAGNAWHENKDEADMQKYIFAFEKFVLDGIKSPRQRLVDLDRIRSLFVLLEWHGRQRDAKWLDQTRYMEIEHGLNKINEYKERPVLPDPHGVLQRFEQATSDSDEPVMPEIAPIDPDVKIGTVEEWRYSYGFIKPEDGGRRVFVHKNQLARGLRVLKEGQRVRFHIGPGMKGLEAKDVHLDE
jgi:CRISPR-associated protein (TIGR03986 family)